jgi:hypothetical protein
MDNSDYGIEKFYMFLRQAGTQGLINPAVARSRIQAAEHLFTELTEDEQKDLRCLKLKNLGARFHKIHDTSIRPEVLELYLQRLQGALHDFINWVDNPYDFKSVGGESRRKDKRYQASDKEIEREQQQLEASQLQLSDMPRDVLSIPLRDEVCVYLSNLPLDLTPDEANKIARVVKALAGGASDETD